MKDYLELAASANPPMANRWVNLQNAFKQIENSKKVIFLDWLEINVELEEKFVNLLNSLNAEGVKFNGELCSLDGNNCSVKILNCPSKLFKFRFEVYIEGILFISGPCFARGGVKGCTERTAIMKVENFCLYKWGIIEIFEFIESVEFIAKIKNFVRIDVAMDVNYDAITDLFEVLSVPEEKKEIVLKGNKKYYFNGWNQKKGCPYSIIIGSRASDTRVIVYDKKEELKNSKKLYIHQIHKEIGFDTSKEVTRFEASITGKVLKSYQLHTASKEEFKYSLQTIFGHVLIEKLTFLKKISGVERRKWASIYLSVVNNMVQVERMRIAHSKGQGEWLTKINTNYMIREIIEGRISEEFIEILAKFLREELELRGLEEWADERFQNARKKLSKKKSNIIAILDAVNELVTGYKKGNYTLALMYLRGNGDIVNIDNLAELLGYETSKLIKNLITIKEEIKEI